MVPDYESRMTGMSWEGAMLNLEANPNGSVCSRWIACLILASGVWSVKRLHIQAMLLPQRIA